MNKLEHKHYIIWIPLLLIFYNFCANLANDIYLPSLPQLVKVFNSSSNTLQLTISVWFAGVALPQLFFGPLTDKIGRRPVLIGGGICFIVATIVCGLATNIWVMIIARFFQGVGVCSLNVTTYSILSDLYPYQMRTRITNKINMCGTLAPLIGPVIGGYLLTYMGWRSNFALLFVMGCLSIWGLYKILPESNLSLNGDALKLKSFYRNYYHLFKNKYLIKHLIPYCLLLGGLVAYLTAAPFLIISKLKIAPEHFGYTQLPIFTAYLLGALYLGRSSDESIKKLLMLGVRLIFMSSGVMLILSYFFGTHLWSLILPMIVYAVGLSFCSSPLVSEVMSSVTSSKGAAAAFLGFGMAVSCMTSSLILGIFYNGTMISIASILFIISALATSIFFKSTAVAHSGEESTELRF